VIVTLGDLTKDKSALLDKLVSDCITFGLHPKEALEYIRTEFGSISDRTYFRRQAKMMSEDSSKSWLSYFTRIGFIQLHRQQMDTIQRIQDDSLNRFHIESRKEVRDENLILKIKDDIRENSTLLSEYGLGTPIISAIKDRLEKVRDIKSDDFPTNNP
jgi:hypothetical protein